MCLLADWSVYLVISYLGANCAWIPTKLETLCCQEMQKVVNRLYSEVVHYYRPPFAVQSVHYPLPARYCLTFSILKLYLKNILLPGWIICLIHWCSFRSYHLPHYKTVFAINHLYSILGCNTSGAASSPPICRVHHPSWRTPVHPESAHLVEHLQHPWCWLWTFKA